jgi:hypothetical protein
MGIRRIIRKLVGFGTRHTLSDTVSDTRGIGAARRWIKTEFDRISAAAGGKLEVSYQYDLVKGGESRRIPEDTWVVNVVAIQRGRPIFTLEASFHKPEQGIEYQAAMPQVPPPDELARVVFDELNLGQASPKVQRIANIAAPVLRAFKAGEMNREVAVDLAKAGLSAVNADPGRNILRKSTVFGENLYQYHK